MFKKSAELQKAFAAQLESGNVVVVERVPGKTAGTMNIVLMQKQKLDGRAIGLALERGASAVRGAFRRSVSFGVKPENPLFNFAVGAELPSAVRLEFEYFSTNSKRALIDGKLRTNAYPSRIVDGKPVA